MGYSPWGCKESDTTEATQHTHTHMILSLWIFRLIICNPIHLHYIITDALFCLFMVGKLIAFFSSAIHLLIPLFIHSTIYKSLLSAWT